VRSQRQGASFSAFNGWMHPRAELGRELGLGL